MRPTTASVPRGAASSLRGAPALAQQEELGLQLLGEMGRKGVAPDTVVYNAAISACRHEGEQEPIDKAITDSPLLAAARREGSGSAMAMVQPCGGVSGAAFVTLLAVGACVVKLVTPFEAAMHWLEWVKLAQKAGALSLTESDIETFSSRATGCLRGWLSPQSGRPEVV